jgi:hypothetical protein
MRTWENFGEKTTILSCTLDSVKDYNDCLRVFADFLNEDAGRTPQAIFWQGDSVSLVYTTMLNPVKRDES